MQKKTFIKHEIISKMCFKKNLLQPKCENVNFLSTNRLLYKFNGKGNIKTNEATEPPTVLAINVFIREILIHK